MPSEKFPGPEVQKAFIVNSKSLSFYNFSDGPGMVHTREHIQVLKTTPGDYLVKNQFFTCCIGNNVLSRNSNIFSVKHSEAAGAESLLSCEKLFDLYIHFCSSNK